MHVREAFFVSAILAGARGCRLCSPDFGKRRRTKPTGDRKSWSQRNQRDYRDEHLAPNTDARTVNAVHRDPDYRTSNQPGDGNRDFTWNYRHSKYNNSRNHGYAWSKRIEQCQQHPWNAASLCRGNGIRDRWRVADALQYPGSGTRSDSRNYAEYNRNPGSNNTKRYAPGEHHS
jgi:hypothetical protein